MSDRFSNDVNVTVDEQARRRFERGWAVGQPEPIEGFLPPEGSPGYGKTLLELVLIELEMSWKAGRGRRVEEYLDKFPALRDAALLPQLLQEEYLLRHRHGERPERAEYVERFPDVHWTAFDFETAAEKPRQNVEPSWPSIPGLAIVEPLGRGGMGIVYKAHQSNLDRLVAVKQILSCDDDLIARFHNEAHAAAKLRHPNVVQVYEVGEAGGRPFLVLEYVDGGTLAQQLHGMPQQPRTAATIIACLARAVQAIHAEGLLHRDLKPGNVLVSKSGTFKIADFGLTKRVDSAESSALTETGAILGTPSYMAPEQASGHSKDVGPPADIYALGAMLYEMIVGHPPFRGATPMETLLQVVNHEPVPPRRLQPTTPRDLETICLKCLEKQPGRRYASAAELAEDVERFLEHEPIRARPVGKVERAWRWCRRKPAQAMLIAVLVMAVVGGVIGGFVWLQAKHAHELKLAEDARKKLEEDVQKRDKRHGNARGDRRTALEELHAGRFDAARLFLERARDRLAREPQSDPLVAEINRQYDRVNRLTTFYRNADRAERFAFLESDQRALTTCEEGLRALGVFDHPETWWTKLPADELRPEQAAKLIRDADHQLTMLAGLWVKEGQESGTEREGQQKALEILKLPERYREANGLPPSVAGRILQGYVHAKQFQFGKIRRLDNQEPRSASDCYFLGVAMFWTAQAPGDWISQAVSLTFPLMGVKIGEPKKAGERLLRQAAAEEPSHYWSHFWLGWCLLAQGDTNGAELSFTTCTTLRPEEGLAYAERARLLAFAATRTKDRFERDALVRRCESDISRALRYAPADWYVQQPVMQSYSILGRQKETYLTANRMLDLITPPHVLQSRLRAEQEIMLKYVAEHVDFAAPEDPAEVNAIKALVSTLLKKDDDALKFADAAAKTKPDHPRVRLVRGILHLRKKDLPAATADLTASLAAAPKCFLARLALCRTTELTEKYADALRGYEELVKDAETDGQRLGAHLGCYRNLQKLGRNDDAQKALEHARAIDPKAATPTQK